MKTKGSKTSSVASNNAAKLSGNKEAGVAAKASRMALTVLAQESEADKKARILAEWD